MSRRLLVVWAGRHQREPWQQLCADYRRRIAHEMPIDEQWIKVKGSSEDPARLRKEGEAMQRALPDPCTSIVLDPTGRRLGSEAFTTELMRLRDEWPHPVAFLIGSDLGLDAGVKKSANMRLSFSSMTFSHELARVILYEQIYRAFSLDRGIKYHRA